ncbi:MAG: prepilin-type N-terminal cleavage/methylation domain-containing protein [Candidatus Gastranaerophilales bacterium]|nr:prepilin-type N-terminal cleavage/methylation domain-containing protein [Candidatus Gastranaerophilales bacterium]MCM1073587.1 prepilin-type N-terminal cleavage/methylation domain-containing protein [Bacteroides sp.]
MKKYGFTLAEVLIALGIIGVISSLTAPTFIASIQNSSNAARLAAAVSTLENGFTTMIAKEGVDSEDLLFDTEAWEDTNVRNNQRFAGLIGNYINITGFERNVASEVAYYNSNGPYGLNTNGSRQSRINGTLELLHEDDATYEHILTLKSGATLFFVTMRNLEPSDAEIDSIKSRGGALFKPAAKITIDVNGKNAPNTLGRDIFIFYLGHNGKLYPWGGKDESLFSNGGDGRLWSSNTSAIRCLDNNIRLNGLGCTGRVVAEGYKINY